MIFFFFFQHSNEEVPTKLSEAKKLYCFAVNNDIVQCFAERWGSCKELFQKGAVPVHRVWICGWKTSETP